MEGERRRDSSQLVALHLLFMLLHLLREGLSHEVKPVLLQVLISYLLLYINDQVVFFCSVLWPVDKAVPVR